MSVDTSCHLGKKKMETPLLIAAGQPTGATGKIKDIAGRMAKTHWSGIVTKTISLGEPLGIRPHLWKSPQYGLSAMQNYGPGHSIFSPSLVKELSEDAAVCHREGLLLIANIQGKTLEEWKRFATEVASAGVDGIELNISFGHITRKFSQEGEYETSKIPSSVKEIVSTVVEAARIPVIPKFTAHLSYPAEIAQICADAGAAGISAINTLRGMIGIDVNSHIPYSRDVTDRGFMGGISGTLIKPVALGTVAEIVKKTGISVYGIGGITDWTSGVEFLLAGAQAFQVCTGVMMEGFRLGNRIYDGLIKYMEENHYQRISDFRGAALKHLSDKPQTPSEAISIINPKKCTRCLRCVVACKEAGYQAIVTDKKADFLVQVLAEKCTGCGLCFVTCKDDAVEIRERT